MLIDYHRYTIFPDYGMSPYAWLVEAGKESNGIGYCAGDGIRWAGHIPISKELEADFAEWSIKYESDVDCDCEPDYKFDWKVFHDRGIELTKRLKAELGSGSLVYYVKPHEDPDHDVEGRRIVMEDGSLMELSGINEYIPDAMEKIEQDQNVRILYAVESGSRAWGFASQNSDFDVRFIYIHKLD